MHDDDNAQAVSKKSSPTEIVASRLLASHGVRAIWDLHTAAAAAYGMGEHELAEMMIELADAAEHEWGRAHQPVGAAAPLPSR